MIQEDKELLLKDLSARLPYGVRISKAIDDFVSEPKLIKSLYPDGTILVEDEFPDVDAWDICEIKPYLRPLSSMTEEEKKKYIEYAGYEIEASVNGRHYEYYLKDFCGTPNNPSVNSNGVDWLNKNMFDYRGLIPMGLAIEAPKDMYMHLKT